MHLSYETLSAHLAQVDTLASQKVTNEDALPFAAGLYVYDPAMNKAKLVHSLVTPAIERTADPTAHADSQIITPKRFVMLMDALTNSNSDNQAVLVVSNAESCMACRARFEILARLLCAHGLIEKNRFIVAYGASAEETAALTGIDNRPLAADMLAFSRGRMDAQPITVREPTRRELRLLADHHHHRNRAFAAIVTNTRITTAPRATNDLFALAEVNAIRHACKGRKDRGETNPSDLTGATLLTTADAIGPLAYASAWLAGIRTIVLCKPPAFKNELSPQQKLEEAAKNKAKDAPAAHAPEHDYLGHHEGYKIDNKTLFHIVVENGWKDLRSRVRYVQVEGFENKAQQAYAAAHRQEAKRFPATVRLRPKERLEL